MTIRLAALFAPLVLCGAAPVLAAEGQTPAPRAESAENGSERVCRVQKVLGSRLGSKRVCLTRDQWRQQRQDDRQNVEMVQQKNRHGNIETGL
jgi:hypothetical protein